MADGANKKPSQGYAFSQWREPSHMEKINGKKAIFKDSLLFLAEGLLDNKVKSSVTYQLWSKLPSHTHS